MVFLDQSKTIIQIFNYLWDRRFPNYNSFSRYDKKTYLLCEKRWNDYVSDHLYELSKTCKAIGASYEKEKKIMFPRGTNISDFFSPGKSYGSLPIQQEIKIDKTMNWFKVSELVQLYIVKLSNYLKEHEFLIVEKDNLYVTLCYDKVTQKGYYLLQMRLFY